MAGEERLEGKAEGTEERVKYRCRIVLTYVSEAARNHAAEADRRLFLEGELGTLSRDARTFMFEADILDGKGPPRTKQLRAEFEKKLVNPKHFLVKVENPKPVTVSRHNGLAATRQRIDFYHEQLGLPRVAWPEYDTPLDKKLHDAHQQCPFCGSEDLDQGDYDGDTMLTCTVECGDCVAKWGEKYAFVGGWVLEKPEGT